MFQNPAVLIALGVVVGVFSGLMGLGGGSIMIPIMVILLGFTQTKAHGTSLAVMIPPVALPAVIRYAREGQVDWRIAVFLAIGVVCGSWFGARIATSISDRQLKFIFGFLLIYVAGYTIFGALYGKVEVRKAALASLLLVAASVAVFWALKLMHTPGAAD